MTTTRDKAEELAKLIEAQAAKIATETSKKELKVATHPPFDEKKWAEKTLAVCQPPHNVAEIMLIFAGMLGDMGRAGMTAEACQDHYLSCIFAESIHIVCTVGWDGSMENDDFGTAVQQAHRVLGKTMPKYWPPRRPKKGKKS